MALNKDSFLIVNPKAPSSAPQTIYVTSDPSYNPLVFTITNNTGADIKLVGGKAVNKSGGASSFVIDFSNMLSSTEVQAIKITDTLNQWAPQFFPSTGSGVPDAWGLAPINDLTLPAGGVVTFNFSKLTCAETTPGNFDVCYFNIPGMADRGIPYVYHMAKSNTGGKPLPLDYNFVDVVHPIGPQTTSPTDPPGSVINVDITYDNGAPIKNGFTITLTNTLQAPLEPDNTPIGNAAVYISFVFATDDDDAITSQSNGDKISIALDAQKTTWNTVNHVPGTSSWQFLPQSPNLMAANETVNFVVSNLITDLNTNPNKISIVYVQVSSFAGYNDAVYTFEMEKVKAVASIYPNSFVVSPSVVNYGTDVSLTWTTVVAARVTLEYADRDGKIYLFDSASKIDPIALTQGPPGFQPSIPPNAPTTIFTLSAYDTGTTPTVSVPATLTVIEPPATATLTADSYLVNIDANPNTTTLRWSTNNAQTVTLNGNPVNKSDTLLITVTKTITYTLVATPYGTTSPPVTVAITVFAYHGYAPVLVGPAGTGNVFQSLPLSLVNNNSNVQEIYVSNAANGGSISTVSQASRNLYGKPFTGTIITLSPDRTWLIVAQIGNNAPSNMNVYSVSGPTPTPSSSAQIPGPPPYCMSVSLDGSLLFAAQQHLLTAVSVYTLSTGKIAYKQDITVGQSPRAIAFYNGNVYIANYDSQSVSVINQTSLAVTNTISIAPNSEPRAFALVGSTLYVCCEGGNTIVYINLNNNAVNSITVGNRPFSFTLNQNSSLLYVNNFGANTVSVVNTSTNTVVNTITVGNNPSASRITQSGSLMFVSNYCDKSLSVVNLTTNPASLIGNILLEQTNGNPVDISTFPNNNGFTDVFIAKENFTERNSSCTGSVTDTNLNMSILSVQESYNPQ